jgi:hypothetical protein
MRTGPTRVATTSDYEPAGRSASCSALIASINGLSASSQALTLIGPSKLSHQTKNFSRAATTAGPPSSRTCCTAASNSCTAFSNATTAPRGGDASSATPSVPPGVGSGSAVERRASAAARNRAYASRRSVALDSDCRSDRSSRRSLRCHRRARIAVARDARAPTATPRMPAQPASIAIVKVMARRGPAYPPLAESRRTIWPTRRPSLTSMSAGRAGASRTTRRPLQRPPRNTISLLRR